MSQQTASLNVLFVCTGNICRSPMAEQVFRKLATEAGLSLTFESAGVYAEVGEAIHPQSAEAMRLIGFEPQTHAARQLNSDLTSGADLILTATSDHSNSTAQIDPAASRKTFTLLEFDRIANFLSQNTELASPSTVTEKIAAVSQYRGYAPRTSESEDIIDPWGRSFESYTAVTEQTKLAAERIINWLGVK